MPELYIIITGSNGAGKSTVGPDYLPSHILQQCEIFDGDKLFMRKRSELWNSGINSHKECKRLAFEFVTETFEKLVDNAISSKISFVYEGHFTNESTWDIPKRFKETGYSIHLIFFGLTNTDLSELRVIARSREGGHYVDPNTVANNFYGNLEKLDIHFHIFDSIQIIDTSDVEHNVLCIINKGIVTSYVNAKSLPDWFIKNLKTITTKIMSTESQNVSDMEISQ